MDDAPLVLVVEDNAANADLAALLLEAQGLRVQVAFDADQALAALALALPDLILADIQLPGMDGLALTQRLKGDARTRHVPVIALTAYAMSGDEARMRAAGCDGYLSKPLDVRTFGAHVARIANASRGEGGGAAGAPAADSP